MPCSRSARRPSVSSARSSVPSPPRRSDACATCASWSSKTCLESYSSRPISVLLPSSTDPAVVKRSRSSVILEIPCLLAVLHRRLRDAVIGACLAPLGDARRRDLQHDLLQRRRPRAHAARAAHVAHRAVAHRLVEHRLALDQLRALAPCVQHVVALEHRALVREVDRRDLQLLLVDVLPHVQLSPVRQREHAYVLALFDAPVVQVPQLRELVLRVPLAEVVAEGEHALLRPRTLL